MGTIRVTSRPGYYAALETQKREDVSPESDLLSKETLSVTFAVGGLREGAMRLQQRRIKNTMAAVLHEKPVYVRQYNYSDDLGYYQWPRFTLHKNKVITEQLPIAEMENLLSIIRAFHEAGWYPEDEIKITYFPIRGDLNSLYNLVIIIESRMPLIVRALDLQEDPQIIVNYGIAMSFSFRTFSYTAIEAAAYLIVQADKMALTTSKARMKSCDMSNPKYQMRSWLLRLGFIGDQFERPRKTLLERLDGDTAFYSEEQKQIAIAKRKAKKMNTYLST